MKQNKMQFVDIHTHILPGVDDGAANMEQALELLRMSREDGIGAVVLTPHYRSRFQQNSPERVMQSFEALCQEAHQRYPQMELYLGSEVAYVRDVTEKLGDGTVLTLNDTHYVLLEFDTNCYRSRVIDGVLEVLNCGYVPIIAHVERYSIFRKKASLIDEVLDMGALIQLNANGVMGKLGFGVKRYCHRLLKTHKVHFVASDAHDTESRRPQLKACYERIAKKYGKSYAAALFYENARAMLAGEETIC